MADTAALNEVVKPEVRSRVAWAISDALVLIKRTMTHIIRNPDQLASVVVQPIMFMLLFRYVFGGSIETGGGSYINFLFAGIVVQTAAFGSTYTSIGVATDLQRGIINRFKSLPMLSSAVLLGHTVADLVRNTASTLVMLLVALLVGFRPQGTPLDWLVATGVLLIFTFAFSWLFAIIGLLARSIEAVQWIGFVFVFPLTFASSAFAPTINMPGPLQAFAANQPVNQVIEAIRAAVLGQPYGNHVWLSVIWSLAILVVCVPLSGYLFRRKAIK